MIYSVWNQGALRYDYFETSEPATTVNAAAPKHLRPTKLGLTPAQASWPLPASARPVGSGAQARGRVAHRRGGELAGVTDSAFGLISSPFGFVIALGLGYAAWKLSKLDTDKLARGRRRRR